MTLLPIAAAAMALNSVLVLGMAAFVTERDEARADRRGDNTQPILGL